MPPLIVSHNNIQSIVYNIQKRRRWQNAVSRSGAKFMVLENQLFGQAKNILGVDNTIRLKHPTYGHIEKYEKAKKARKHLSFLYDFIMIGRHGRVKESVREILQASEEIIQEALNEIYNITIRIAFTGPEMDLVPSDHRIQLISLGKYPAFDEYLLAIARSRFVVFPSAASARMTASGTLADAMSVGTPVIAPSEGAFQFFCEDLKEFDKLFYKSNYRLKFSLKYALEIKEQEYQRVSDIVETTAQKRWNEFTAGICGALNKCMEIKQI
jgi:glycosyltransferase involved in cell wall biosynthesis